jgi:4-amino-4-deoxy-L-arabinose transferase-like glycosyltransferase
MPHLKIKFFLPLLALLLVYFVTRFQHLQTIPVFGDEAIYLRWSQLIKNVETLRFVPLSDGKEPLYMWVTAVTFKFIADPLIAGRFLSIIFGGLTIVALYIFSLIFLNYPIAILSTIVYIFLPFTFFFDRLALPDNLLSFLGMGSLLFTFLLAKYPRLDLSIILGVVLGLSWLTKSPAIYFIVLSILTYILYKKNNYKKLYFPIISSIIAFTIFNILRLGPQFSQIAIRNQDYIWPLTEILKHPLDPLKPHFMDILNIYGEFISFPLLILSFLGIILYTKHSPIRHQHHLISLWWILPLIANSGIAKVFTARYILFTVPPLILLMATGIYYFFQYTREYFKNKLLQILILVICFAFNFYWLYRISINPYTLNLSSTETGYISGWTSGWGIKDASKYLIQRSKTTNVIVGTEGYFGTLPDGLQIYTDSLKNITVFGVGIDLTDIPSKLIDARNYGDEVYMLFNQSRLKLTPSQLNEVTLVSRYPKPGNDYLLLYRLN